MDTKFFLVTVGTWFLFMVLAILNAGIRNGVFKPIIGDLRAHQLSTFIFMVLILIVTTLVLRFSHLQLTDTTAFLMGTIWMIATLCFEFLAGHFVFGNSWDLIFHDYNILQGRIWILVPLTTFVAPYIAYKII
jgi:hypothetical protein